jgi:hypothetical protein
MKVQQQILFTKAECDDIIDFSTNIPYNRTDGWYKNNPNINYTDWTIPSTGNMSWVFERVLQFAQPLIEETIKSTPSVMHLHKYNVGDGFERHNDELNYRKYVCGLILNTDFEGGSYVVEIGDEKVEIAKAVGNVYMFDVRRWHVVSPITKGVRWSCVLFIQNHNLSYKVKSLI